MSKSFIRIWNIFTTLLVTLVVILALLLVGVRLFGFQVFTVLSGSMEPTYHVGALIYVKKVDTMELRSGDVITFMLDEDTVATHRIVEVVPDEEDPSVIRFRTKGDANDNVDGSLVHYKNVLGTPVFTIPLLGYLASYIQNPPGSYVALSLSAVFLLLVFLPDLFADSGKDSKGRAVAGKRKGRAGKASLEPEAAGAQREAAVLPEERTVQSRKNRPGHAAAPARTRETPRVPSLPRQRRGKHEAGGRH